MARGQQEEPRWYPTKGEILFAKNLAQTYFPGKYTGDDLLSACAFNTIVIDDQGNSWRGYHSYVGYSELYCEKLHQSLCLYDRTAKPYDPVALAVEKINQKN